MEQPVTYYSDGLKINARLYLPDDLKPGERRAAVVLVQGFATSGMEAMKTLARQLNAWGYIALDFDFRGFGKSEGRKWHMLPLEQAEDARAGISFLEQHPSVLPESIGLYGASYGGALVMYTTGIDPRVRCVVSVVGVGNGASWMRSLRPGWQWVAFQKELMEDRVRRATTGQSKIVPRGEVLIYEPEVAARQAQARPAGDSPSARELPLHTAQAVIDFAPDAVASRITNQPALFIVCERDQRVPNEVTREVYDAVRGPKRWVVAPGVGHDAVYQPPVWEHHLAEVRSWLEQHLPAKGRALRPN